MKTHNNGIFALCLAFAASMSASAGEEGWDNLDPARREREPARLYWEAPLAKGAAAFDVEKCGGAEGDVSFADGAMTVRKTNEKGWIAIRAKERFAVKAGTTVRSFADAEIPDADQFHSVAVLRLSGKKNRLHSDWTLDAVEPFMCGGPKMGYLSCTAPGQTDRRFASLQVTETFGTNVAPVMVVAGAPSTSIWRRWGVEDHDRAHGAWKCHIGRHSGVKGRFSEGISAEEYLARLANDTDHTAKVVVSPGETRLVVDGKVEAPVIYKPNHGWPASWYRTTGSFLSTEGVKLQTVVVENLRCWRKAGFEAGIATNMAAAIDQMRRAPDALFIMSFNLSMPPEYTAERPDEVWLDPKGQTVYGNNGKIKNWGNGKPPKGCWPWPSMFSRVWRKDVEAFISAVVEGLKRKGLAKRIVGFHICGYHDGQFSPYLPDHSAHGMTAFREWMAAERGKQLPADFVPPVFSDKEEFFGDSPEDVLKREWQTFQHIAPLRVQENFARRLKAAFGKEVVALHWCMDVLGGNRNGAYYLGEFMKSDVMDGLVAQPSYVQRLPSLALGEGIPSASFVRHGKLYVDEFDLRTYGLIAGYVKEPGAYGLGHARDFAEWQSIHHRIAGVSMARRQAWWYYEISGGFFEPPEIAADIGTVTRLRGEQARAKNTSAWRPSAALVIDEEGLLARNMMVNSPLDARRLLNTHQLAAAGVPYEVWLAADFMKDPALAASYRIVLLEGFYDMTEARAAFVRRLLAGGCTVVLFAGTGAAGGADRLGLKPIYRKPPVNHEVESLTGDGAEFRSAFYTDELRWSLGVTGGPILALWRPACFAFGEMPGFKPLARYVKDGAMAAVESQVRGGRLVALGEAGGLTPAFFNRLAREAGGYVPVTGGGLLQVDMNGDFVSIHALKTGRYDFRLPFPCEVKNLKTGKIVPTLDDTLPLDLVAGETRWYSLQASFDIHQLPSRHIPKRIMGRDYWPALYKYRDWLPGVQYDNSVFEVRFDNPDIFKLPAFRDAAPVYWARNDPPPVEGASGTWRHFADNFTAAERDREIIASNPYPDRPFLFAATANRKFWTWGAECDLDHAEYADWLARHPNALYSGTILEWDNDIMLAYRRLAGLTNAVRRAKVEALIGKHPPKTREERMAVMRRHFADRRRAAYGGKMAVHASHVFSQHLGGDCGADMLVVEMTNSSGSPTSNSEYRWNLAPMFVRGAARQFDRPWEWYWAAYMNGFRTNGEWHNNAACRYPERPDYGISGSLMRRLYYFAYLSGANVTQPEEWSAYFLTWDEKAGKTMLTYRGRDYVAYHDFTQAHPGRGVPYTPVAICIPLARGYPAYGGWPWAEKDYGYTRSDLMSDAVFFSLVPGFERAKAMKAGIETNLHNSRFAQMYDVICPDAPNQSAETILDVMKSYKALVVAGEFADAKVATCLAEYEKGGGRVVRLPAALFANLNCSQIANAANIDSSVSYRLMGELKAGKMRFPEIEALFEDLQNAYFPFKVDGDCMYGANRTADGWWLWVFNNKGVTKFTDAPHTVDHSFDAEITVSHAKGCIATAKELLTGKALPVENGTFRHRVTVGDLAVFEVGEH